MARIFISYKRVDKDKVFPIVEEIKQKTGVDCWIDLEGIESGDQFQNVIIDAIDNADIVVFMLSKNFIAPYKDEKTGKIDLKKQTFPEKEVMYALRHNKRLIPLSIDGTTINDCKWLEFNCSGLDCIIWINNDQRDKFLHNIRQWNGHKGNNSVSLNGRSAKTSFSEQSDKDYNLFSLSFKKIKKNKGCVIAITVAFVFCIVVLPIGYFSFETGSPMAYLPMASLPMALNTNGDEVENEDGKPYVSVRATAVSSQQKDTDIDLGLPSGTLWADKNIGAKYDHDYGYLYSWGEVKPKKDYRQVCYKGINTDNIIGTQYDIATTHLGSDWQIPSKEQFDELINECTWEWKANGVSVIGKNGNSIFLPASGWSCSSAIEYRDQYGYYWTGEKVNSKFAKGLFFSKTEHYTGNGTLYYGRAVRAVKRK